MSGALHITIDPQQLPIRRAICACFGTDVRVVLLTSRAYDDLARELGGSEAAAAYLVRLCKRFSKPAAVNVEHPDGTSRTVLFSPPGWSQERLLGYVGGLHGELEELFGEVSHLETPGLAVECAGGKPE